MKALAGFTDECDRVIDKAAVVFETALDQAAFAFGVAVSMAWR
jgi:hypothetical protein